MVDRLFAPDLVCTNKQNHEGMLATLNILTIAGATNTSYLQSVHDN